MEGSVILAFVIAAMVLVILIYRIGTGIQQWRARRRFEASLIDVAFIAERCEATGAGSVCLALLVLVNAVALLMLFGGQMKTILQETVAALIWIALNQVLCLGVALGRSRSYTVRRPPSEKAL